MIAFDGIGYSHEYRSLVESLIDCGREANESGVVESFVGLFREGQLCDRYDIAHDRSGLIRLIACVEVDLVESGLVQIGDVIGVSFIAHMAISKMSDGLIEALMDSALEVLADEGCGC